MAEDQPEFRSTLRVEELRDGRRRLLEPLIFYSATLRGELVAPAGFITDYASTPRGSWNLFPRDGPYKWAAVMHDAAYHGALVTNDGLTIHLIKPLADKLFLEGMKALGVSKWKRGFMYAIVAQFGGRPYGGLGEPVVA